LAKLADIAAKVRSKNAGPFWLTIDIFCETEAAFQTVNAQLSTARVAALYDQRVEDVERFEIPGLAVLKFSMPRPVIQGALEDRDMHASQWGWLLAELELN